MHDSKGKDEYGQQSQFSDAAVQTCLTLKVLFVLPLRQTASFGDILLHLVRLTCGQSPSSAPSASSKKTLTEIMQYHGGPIPSILWLNIICIRFESEGEWQAPKHCGPHRHNLTIFRSEHDNSNLTQLSSRKIGASMSSFQHANERTDNLDALRQPCPQCCMAGC